jgi:8-oxo-dGTP pyrophosphatase MutT (NUDIX family)
MRGEGGERLICETASGRLSVLLSIWITGSWSRGAVHITRAPSTRRIVSEVEAIIESTWQKGKARLGDHLFDGPMCRMEHWRKTGDSLELSLSETSYRIFYGTNLMNAGALSQYGREVMANPVGVSTALQTSDGYLLFGRRNARVAYHPNRVHPFAGTLEPRDGEDVFSAVERELHEELKITAVEIESIRCIGIVEDDVIKHPELIFHASVRLTREQVESQLQRDEHGGSVAIQNLRGAIGNALADEQFTPVAMGTLLLFGREGFGDDWLKRCASRMPGVTLRNRDSSASGSTD